MKSFILLGLLLLSGCSHLAAFGDGFVAAQNNQPKQTHCTSFVSGSIVQTNCR